MVKIRSLIAAGLALQLLSSIDAADTVVGPVVHMGVVFVSGHEAQAAIDIVIRRPVIFVAMDAP
jgi:hypothetical protein